MRFTGEDAKKLIKAQGKNIIIPYGYTSIFDAAFYYCANLKSVMIPDSVAIIEMCAFWNCKNLVKITVPDSVTAISRDAFKGCDKAVIYCSGNSYAYKYCMENDIKVKKSSRKYKAGIYKIKVQNEFEAVQIQAQPVLSGVSFLSNLSKEAKELADKIEVYCKDIRDFSYSVKDTAISSELIGMEKAMRRIQAKIKDEKDKENDTKLTEKTGQFLEYYMPTVIKILSSYKNIEKHNLTDAESTATKKHVSEVLPTIKRAFEREFSNMFDNERLSLYSDVKGLEAMLAMDGFVDDGDLGK